MNIRKAGCLSLFGLVFAAFAGGANAADCATAQFSDTVLERFPNIASACQDVIEKDGQMYAVIKSDLVRTDRDALFVRVQMPDGSRSQTRRIPVSRDFRVVINGRPVGLDQVAVGQELTTYVRVSEPVMALVLDEEEVETVPLEPAVSMAVVAVARAPQEAPTMPRTASLVPAMGIAGALLIAFGLSLGWALRQARARVRRE
jgi:hypothetical protein